MEDLYRERRITLKNRILVISWFYPPVNSSEGLVTYKLLKASKYEYDVFTQRNNALWSYGNKDNLSECKNVKSIFAKAKPANEHTVNVNITPTTATKTLLKI